MRKHKRTAIDKLKTLLFGKDLRITEGEPYTEVRPYDYSSYYPKDKYNKSQARPSENFILLSSLKSKPNDTDFDNSEIINSAIEDLSKNGGGTLVVDNGVYTTTTVFMKSGVTLFIERDSAIIANQNGKGYTNRALISATNCKNITFTGGGKAVGNGNFYGRRPLLDKNITEPSKIIDVIQMRIDYRAQIRFAHPNKFGSILKISNSENVKIENFIFENSADWTCRIEKSNNVIIKNSIINNNRQVANADGFDMVQSNNIEIDHCFVSTADDGIVLKNAIWENCDGDMENISISNCEIISRTNAIKIGTETTNDIHDIKIKNCSLLMTDVYPGSVSGISLETCDGSRVYNVDIQNIKMDRCTCPLFIRLNNRNRAAKVSAETVRNIEYGLKVKNKPSVAKNKFFQKSELFNINVENIVANNIEIPVIIAGYKEKGVIKRVKNVTLNNFQLTYREAVEVIDKRLFIPEYVKDYPECWRFRNLPAYAIWARHVENLKIDNFLCKPAPSTWKKEKVFIDVI